MAFNFLVTASIFGTSNHPIQMPVELLVFDFDDLTRFCLFVYP